MKNPPACVLKCSPKRDNFNHLNFTPRLSYRVSDCASFELLKTSSDAMFSLKNMLALIAGLDHYSGSAWHITIIYTPAEVQVFLK